MFARTHKPKRRQPIPFEPAAVQLPLPVTQKPCVSGPKTVRFQSIASKWGSMKAYLKHTLAAPYVPSSSSLVENVSEVISPLPTDTRKFNENGEVDEVVVDRDWSEDLTESNSDDAETASSRHDATATEAESLDVSPEGFWAFPPLAFIRCRMWPIIREFYMPRFGEAEEHLYQKEVWGQTKRVSLWASVFFIVSCLAAMVSIQDPIVLADKASIFYYGISPLLTVPILFMCAYNFPYDHTFFFQAFLCVSTWSWPFYEILYAFLCGFYSPNDRLFTCGSKDFLATFYYTSALQAVALFGTIAETASRNYWGPRLSDFVRLQCSLAFLVDRWGYIDPASRSCL
ncbi:hypothetical protein DFH09DRAFT_1455905 [Mycena vulgaris]|nr:hypothetical protein DFH09DRAFT_1455905 [Mycena vulgaris]